MKIHPVGAGFHVDGQTGRMTKLIVAFRNFANAPKMTVSDLDWCSHYLISVHLPVETVEINETLSHGS
jgi:hypothetical protein